MADREGVQGTHLGVKAASSRTGKPPASLYLLAARRRVNTRMDASGKLLFEVASLDRVKAEEVARRARREAEKRDAAKRLTELMAKRRARRGGP